MDGLWSIIKDGAAFLGSICLFLPWIKDFSGRVALERLKGVSSNLELLKRLRDRRRSWLAKPKIADLWMSLAGMILLTFSFALSLLISLKILPA